MGFPTERNSFSRVNRRIQMFFRQFKATGITVHCVPHCSFATTCTLPLLLYMYVSRIRTLLRASKSPYHSRIFGVLAQCQPAGERAIKRFYDDFSRYRSRCEWNRRTGKFPLMLFESWHAFGYGSVI